MCIRDRYDVIESDEEDACMQLALKNDISLLYEKLESVLTDREQLVLKKRYGLYGEKEMCIRDSPSAARYILHSCVH